jgi:hypothetical protein
MPDEFDRMISAELFADVNAMINQIVELESRARREVDDPAAAASYANEAYAILLEQPLRMLPTLMLALADRVNVTEERHWGYLEVIEKKVIPELQELGRHDPGYRLMTERLVRILSVPEEEE